MKNIYINWNSSLDEKSVHIFKKPLFFRFGISFGVWLIKEVWLAVMEQVISIFGWTLFLLYVISPEFPIWWVMALK